MHCIRKKSSRDRIVDHKNIFDYLILAFFKFIGTFKICSFTWLFGHTGVLDYADHALGQHSKHECYRKFQCQHRNAASLFFLCPFHICAL